MLNASLLVMNEDEVLVSKVYVCLQKFSVHVEPATQLEIPAAGLLANAKCQARDPERVPMRKQRKKRTDQTSRCP